MKKIKLSSIFSISFFFIWETMTVINQLDSIYTFQRVKKKKLPYVREWYAVKAFSPFKKKLQTFKNFYKWRISSNTISFLHCPCVREKLNVLVCNTFCNREWRKTIVFCLFCFVFFRLLFNGFKWRVSNRIQVTTDFKKKTIVKNGRCH